jgi:hypothetical protein
MRCITGWEYPEEPLLLGSSDEEPLGAVIVFATGAGASSSSAHGFNEQLANRADSAITLSLRLIFEQLFAGNMIDVCSIIVIQACPMASVAIICRVAAVQAAKRVTIPAQNRRWRPIIHAALSAILFNKVKNLGEFNRIPYRYRRARKWPY